MDDGVVVETERVEKITRTSSLQQVHIEDSDEKIEVHEVNSRNHVDDSVHHDLLPAESIDEDRDHNMNGGAASNENKQQFDESNTNGLVQESISGVHNSLKKLDENVEPNVNSDIQDGEKDTSCQDAMQNAVNNGQYNHEVEPNQQKEDDSHAKCNTRLEENSFSVDGNGVELSNDSDSNAELGVAAQLTPGQTDAGFLLAATANDKPSVIDGFVYENIAVHSQTVDSHHIDNLSNPNMIEGKSGDYNGTVYVDSHTEKDRNSDVPVNHEFPNIIDIPSDVCETAVDTMESESVESNVDETCQPEAASLSLQEKGPSLEEKCRNIKEPEEHDHHERCHLVADNGISQCTDAREVDQTGSSVEAQQDSWLFLLGHDKLKKRVLKKGEEGKRPSFGQLVTVRCSGRLPDGTEIDRHESLQLVLGDGDSIQAFDMCISHMDRGETCELVTDARYAYGELGREPDVPKNTSLSYEIELQSYEDEPEFSTLPLNDRIQRSNVKRERGNYLYARNECSRAVDAYSKALRIIDDTTETHAGDSGELQLLLDTRVKCYNNLAAAQMKMEDWDGALQSINPVLRVQPANVKALYRKGKCLINKGDHDAAISILKKAAKLEPDTKIIQQELSRLEKWTESQKKSQKAMYKKMIGETKPSVAKEEGSKTWLWYGAAATVLALSAASAVMYRRFTHS